MEQKRLLWIIAATGVFLLVVLGAALIIYAPSARTPQTFASSTKNYNKDTANGWISLSPAPAETSDEKLNFENHFEQNNQPETEAETFAPNAKPEEVITEPEVTAVPSTQQAQTIINNTTTIDLTALPQQIAQAPVPPKEITRAPASVREERRPAPKKYEESKSSDYYEAAPKAQSKKQPVVAEKTVTKPVQQKATHRTLDRQAHEREVQHRDDGADGGTDQDLAQIKGADVKLAGQEQARYHQNIAHQRTGGDAPDFPLGGRLKFHGDHFLCLGILWVSCGR